MVKEWITWKTNKKTEISSFYRKKIDNKLLLFRLFSRTPEDSHKHLHLFYDMITNKINIMNHIKIGKEAETWKEVIFVESNNKHIVIIPKDWMKFNTAFVKDVVSGNIGMLLMEEGESLDWKVEVNIDRIWRKDAVNYFLYISPNDYQIRIINYQNKRKNISIL